MGVVDVVGVVDTDGPDSVRFGAALANATAPVMTMAARPLTAKSFSITIALRSDARRRRTTPRVTNCQ